MTARAGPKFPKASRSGSRWPATRTAARRRFFNQLTGSNQHVGNFPGVTVDRKDGVIRGHAEATVTDLPGIYSLSPLFQ